MFCLHCEEEKCQVRHENVKRQKREAMELDTMVVTLWGRRRELGLCGVREDTLSYLNGVTAFGSWETRMFTALQCTAKSCPGKNCFPLSAGSSTVEKILVD